MNSKIMHPCMNKTVQLKKKNVCFPKVVWDIDEQVEQFTPWLFSHGAVDFHANIRSIIPPIFKCYEQRKYWKHTRGDIWGKFFW